METVREGDADEVKAESLTAIGREAERERVRAQTGMGTARHRQAKVDKVKEQERNEDT